MFQIKMSNEMQEIWKRVISSKLLTRLDKVTNQLKSNMYFYAIIIDST